MKPVTFGCAMRALKTTTILGAMTLPAMAAAQEVTLQSGDGTLKFVGELVEFTDGNYILNTNLGKISIGADGVTCEGDACPDVAAGPTEVTAEATPEALTFGGPVSLQSFDGSLQFEGELIDIAGGDYIIRTQLGDVRIPTNSVTCEGTGCPGVTVASLEPEAEEAPAEPESTIVTLQSFDGDLKFVGDLVEVTNGKYVIKTNLGELRISASTVTCEGAACPTVGSEIVEVATETGSDIEIDFTISGTDLIGDNMMPLLMSGYAASQDAIVELSDDPARGGSVASLVSAGGSGEALGAYLVSTTSTEEAFQALMSGQTQIAMASRRVSPFEARLLQNSGAGDIGSPDQERVIALDNIVVVTHPDNKVGRISIDNLRSIYEGRITNWSQVGGTNAPIKVLTQEPASATRGAFDDRVIGRRSGTRSGQIIVQSDREMAEMVQKDPNAIGYLGYAFQGEAKALPLVSQCGITSIPDAFSAKTEEYLLGRRLYLYNRADNLDEDAQAFLTYAVSENADALIAQSGFINLDVARRVQSSTDVRGSYLKNSPVNGSEARAAVRDMLRAMDANDRLSTTFRFRTGSSLLDEKARGDLPRLVQYLKDLPKGSEITLVGFTDSVGPFDRNQSLAISRANQVRAEIAAAAGDDLSGLEILTAGFGEIAPATCNETEEGRALNRRVEVWISKKNT